MNHIENYYSNYDEDGRLGLKWGQVEFLTTMRYINKYLEQIATDMISRFIRESITDMDDKTFDLYLRFHYAVCERPDMVGMTQHSFDIFRKI
ncbi:MAG: hypothetical protein FWF81_03875 [Defluviitaleaceae bacterium]|nr:hypothetical protein [Defluviitaleaceae bacterium]